MKQFAHFTTTMFFMLAGLSVFGQPADTTIQARPAFPTDTTAAHSTPPSSVDDNDFNPAVLIGVLLLVGFIFTFIGAGIVFTILGLIALFGLVGLGALSTSLIIGLHKKSFAKGFKVFIVLGSTCCGLLLGGPALWLLNTFFLFWTSQTALIAGTISGILGGFGTGLLVFYVLRRAVGYFKRRLDLTI